MVKVLIKRGPRKSDKSTKIRVMKSWMTIIVEEHASDIDIPVISAKELHRIREEKQNGAYVERILK